MEKMAKHTLRSHGGGGQKKRIRKVKGLSEDELFFLKRPWGKRVKWRRCTQERGEKDRIIWGDKRVPRTQTLKARCRERRFFRMGGTHSRSDRFEGTRAKIMKSGRGSEL